MTPRPHPNRSKAGQDELAALDTPALLVERSIMMQNLRAMQSLAERNGAVSYTHLRAHET